MFKSILISSVFLLFPGLLVAQTPVEIIENSRDAVEVSSFEATSTLVIRDNRGNERIRKSTIASKSYPDGTEKRIVKFTSPSEVRGTGTLIFDYDDKDDDMWVYLPALRQTRRIVSGDRGKSYMGSEFANSDMSAPKISDFVYKIVGRNNIDGSDCWIIEAVPVNEKKKDEYGYSRSLTAISMIDFVILKTEFFDFEDELQKTITTTEYRLIDPENIKFMITGMEVVNHKNGRSSKMTMDQIVKSETNDQYFSVSWLEKN